MVGAINGRAVVLEPLDAVKGVCRAEFPTLVEPLRAPFTDHPVCLGVEDVEGEFRGVEARVAVLAVIALAGLLLVCEQGDVFVVVLPGAPEVGG